MKLDVAEITIHSDSPNARGSGYPHEGCADKNPYLHDPHASKDSYSHNGNIQCLIQRLQLSF